jgi:hypothetical protein
LSFRPGRETPGKMSCSERIIPGDEKNIFLPERISGGLIIFIGIENQGGFDDYR